MARKTDPPEPNTERDQSPTPDKKLSLWPLSVDEAVEAILQVPPMPKEKAPPKGRRKGTGPGATAASD